MGIGDSGTNYNPRPIRQRVCKLKSDHRSVGVELTFQPHMLQGKKVETTVEQATGASSRIRAGAG